MLVGGVFLALAVPGIVFVAGMRAKSPPVLNAVRRSGRATKRLVLKSSGTPGGIASVIQHVGRTSGRSYETPVQAVVTDDGFVIALPYGPDTDWLKNVVTSGSATIVDEGTPIRLTSRSSSHFSGGNALLTQATTDPSPCSASSVLSWFGGRSRPQPPMSLIRCDPNGRSRGT